MFVQVVGEGQEYRGRIFPRSICSVMATVFVVLHLWSTSSLCVMQFWKEIHSEFTVKALKGQNSAFLQVKFIEFLSVNVNASRVCDIRYKINDFIAFLLLHFSKFDIEWLCPDAFKYTWEISETSLAFLDIKVSISGNSLCTSVHYKPTDSHSYLLHSSSHPSHVKNSIPYSQFLRLRRLCSDDSDFSNKSKEMCQFFEKRGYPASVIQAAHHRAQQIDRQSTLQTSQKEKNDRIPFTLTFHPRNNPVKAIILNNFKILQNDPETSAIFSQPPLISFKRDKNVGNFLVRSAFKTIEKPGTFKCARSRCKACPFVQNADKISGPKRSVKITDRFTCTSANVIYCITCTLCKKLYIGETGRRLGDRFREHLRDVEKDDKDASKPVARHFNLPNHSKEHMSICGLSLHQGTTDSRKNLEQRFIFQIGTVNPHGINERFSFN